MQLNHVLLRTRDSKAMTQFFVEALGLQTGYRPPFAFDGVWIYSDSRAIIHLVGSDSSDKAQEEYLGSSTAKNGTGIVDHIAFSGSDYPALIERLLSQEYEYFERVVPETKERQVFINGPEKLKIEVVFNLEN